MQTVIEHIRHGLGMGITLLDCFKQAECRWREEDIGERHTKTKYV